MAPAMPALRWILEEKQKREKEEEEEKKEEKKSIKSYSLMLNHIHASAVSLLESGD